MKTCITLYVHHYIYADIGLVWTVPDHVEHNIVFLYHIPLIRHSPRFIRTDYTSIAMFNVVKGLHEPIDYELLQSNAYVNTRAFMMYTMQICILKVKIHNLHVVYKSSILKDPPY